MYLAEPWIVQAAIFDYLHRLHHVARWVPPEPPTLLPKRAYSSFRQSTAGKIAIPIASLGARPPLKRRVFHHLKMSLNPRPPRPKQKKKLEICLLFSCLPLEMLDVFQFLVKPHKKSGLWIHSNSGKQPYLAWPLNTWARNSSIWAPRLWRPVEWNRLSKLGLFHPRGPISRNLQGFIIVITQLFYTIGAITTKFATKYFSNDLNGNRITKSPPR